MRPLTWAAFALALIATNGIVLVIGIPSSTLGWVSFAVMNLSFVLAVTAPLLARGRTRFVFGYPLASLALVQWIIQFLLTLTIVILGTLDVDVAWRIFVFLQLILVGAFGFVFLITASAASNVSRSLDQEARDRSFLQDGARLAANISRASQTDECRRKCREVEELFRYSPAKSTDALVESERLTVALLHQAEVDISAGNEASAVRLLDEVSRLIRSRNADLRSIQ